MLRAASDGKLNFLTAGVAATVVAAVAAVGGTPGAAAAADVSGISLTCAGDHDGPRGLPLTVDVQGVVDGAPVRVGEAVDLGGLQVTLHMSQQLHDAMVDVLDGHTMLNLHAILTADLQWESLIEQSGVFSPPLRFPADQAPSADADVTVPEQAVSMGPFKPTRPGSHRVRVASVLIEFETGPNPLPPPGTPILTTPRGFDCRLPSNVSQDVTVATFDVLPAPEASPSSPPASSPPAGPGGGSGGGGGGTPPTGAGAGSPSPTATVAGQPQGSALARTGASHVGAMTASGAALVLLGAGLVVAMRRRRRTVVVGTGAGDGPTAGG